jgi:hypothetical protein
MKMMNKVAASTASNPRWDMMMSYQKMQRYLGSHVRRLGFH